MSTQIPNFLTIAGSDSSGGAGIQADLKTFGALGAYGLSVLTTITAQNSQEVRGIFDLDSKFVRNQLDTVFDGTKIESLKIGALSNGGIIKEVAEVLKERKPKWIVLDPVLITTSGHRLLPEECQNLLIDLLFPLATLITPNLPESASILNVEIAKNEKEMIEQGRQLLKLGARAVLIKGGHLEGEECVDFLIMDGKEVRFGGRRISSQMSNGDKIDQFHGTGCTLSSAIAVFLSKTNGDLEESVKQAKSYLNRAILSANQLNIGPGPSPLNHFPSN